MLSDLINLGFQPLDPKFKDDIGPTDIVYDIPWIRYHGMGYSQIIVEYSFTEGDGIPSYHSAEHKYHLLTIGGSDAEAEMQLLLKTINSIKDNTDKSLLSWSELLLMAEYTTYYLGK
jgi:hypothetical protein